MTVLVLAPHPDDETVGCGGYLRLAADRGERTVVVFLTSGEAGVPGMAADEAAGLREAEAEAAATVLGLARTVFLRGRDWSLAADAVRLAPVLRRVLQAETPSVILVPHPEDAHPDHQAAWPLLAAALPDALPAALPVYEVWTPMGWFDDVVDVSGVMPAKSAALACYASQLRQLRYDVAAEGLARYRGALAGGCDYAEVFRHEERPEPVLAGAGERHV